MKHLIFIALFLISLFGYSQTKHTYLITISSSENIDQQKEQLAVLRDYFESKNCVYHQKKNAYLINTKKKHNIKQIKIDLDSKGLFVVENIKQNGAQLKKYRMKNNSSNY